MIDNIFLKINLKFIHKFYIYIYKLINILSLIFLNLK